MNESKFQYVIDSMTEEDWQRARETHRQREEENARYEAEVEARKLEEGTPESDSSPYVPNDATTTTTSALTSAEESTEIYDQSETSAGDVDVSSISVSVPGATES